MLRSLFVAAALMACNSLAANHVILITIDGFPARMLQDNRTDVPRIRALAAEGAMAEGMKVSNPSVTWPNHTTLVSGVRPSRHTVLFNGVLVHDDKGIAKIDRNTSRLLSRASSRRKLSCSR